MNILASHRIQGVTSRTATCPVKSIFKLCFLEPNVAVLVTPKPGSLDGHTLSTIQSLGFRETRV